MRSTLACLVILLGCGKPQTDPAPIRTVDPVGNYEFTFVDDGQPITGTMVVSGTPGTFSGRIRTTTRPEVTISTLTASGPLVTVTADIAQGAVLLIRYRVTGDSILGNWMLRNDGGRFAGRRVAAPAAR
jgi:hypothetical protein